MSQALVALVPPTDEAVHSLSGAELREQAVGWEAYGRPAEALRFAAAAVQKDPTCSDAAVLAGGIAARAGDADACDRYFRTADRFGPLPAEAYQVWIAAMTRAVAPLTVSYVVERLLNAYGNDPSNILFASDCYLWLAQHPSNIDGGWGDRRRAGELVLSLMDRNNLGDEMAAQLITNLGEAFEPRLLRAQMAKVEELATQGEGAALSSARFLIDAESYARARAVLRQLPDDNHEAGALLALVDTIEEDPEPALQRFEQLPEEWLATRPGFALSRVICLQKSGRLDEAAAAATSLDEQLSHADGPELKNVRCRLQLIQAALHHQRGDFTGWWRDLAGATAYEVHIADPELQQHLLSLRIHLAVRLDPGAIPSSWSNIDTMLAMLNAFNQEDPSVYVEACADVGDQCDCSRLRATAESAARQAFVAAKARGEGDALKLGRLALLANDNQTAASVLSEPAITNRSDWQALSIRALLYLRQGQASCALNLLEQVMAERRHDIDLRLFYCQAALHAGHVELAIQEAKACHNIAPQHTHANLLLAECIYTSARAGGSSPSSATVEAETQHSVDARSENIYQLAASVSHYRRAVELHEQLPAALSRVMAADLPETVGSGVLPRAMYENALRRGAHAAILATEGLAKHRMVGDRSVRRSGTYLIDQLWWVHHPCCHSSSRRWRLLKRAKHRVLHRIQPRHHETLDEARLLRWLLNSPRRHKWFAWLQSAVLLFGGLFALTEALRSWPIDLGELDSTVQAALLGVATILLLLPAVTKVGFSGFSVERQRSVPLFPGPASMGDPLHLRDTFLMSAAMPPVPRRREEEDGGSARSSQSALLAEPHVKDPARAQELLRADGRSEEKQPE